MAFPVQRFIIRKVDLYREYGDSFPFVTMLAYSVTPIRKGFVIMNSKGTTLRYDNVAFAISRIHEDT